MKSLMLSITSSRRFTSSVLPFLGFLFFHSMTLTSSPRYSALRGNPKPSCRQQFCTSCIIHLLVRSTSLCPAVVVCTCNFSSSHIHLDCKIPGVCQHLAVVSIRTCLLKARLSQGLSSSVVVCRRSSPVTSCGPPTAFPFGHRCKVGVLPGPTGVPQSPG